MFRLLNSGDAVPQRVRVEGPRVYLRAPLAQDWAAWSELREASRAFLTPWEPVWPEDALTRAVYGRRLRRAAAEWRDDESYAFHIFARDGDILLGGLTLGNVRRGVAQMGTLGYWIGERHAGRGYMTEAVGLTVDFAFRQLGLHRVEAACIPNNAASRTVLDRNGFAQEGFARGYLKIAGAWRDHLLFAKLAEDR